MTRKVGLLLAAALVGVGIRALVELGLLVVNLPPVERLGWLITVVSLSVATAAVFALAVGSKRAFVLVLPLLAITVLAWQWQPAGIGELCFGLCLLAGACAGWLTGTRGRASITAVVVFALACAYAVVAEPAEGAWVRYLLIAIGPAIVLVLSFRPATERAAVRALLWSAVPFMLAAGLSAYPFRDRAHVAEDLPRGQPLSMTFNYPFWTDFAPVLVFTRSKERPVTIDEYVIQATGRDLRTQDPFALPNITEDTSVQPGPCGAATPPCYAIENPCYPTIQAAYRDACIGNQGFPSRSGYGVYPRILTRERDVPSDEVVYDPGAFAGVLPFENLSWLVQYWLFYPYDLWRSSEGLVLQQHAGDWEAITVGFSSNEPLFVAYSSHCAGEWREWRDAVAIHASPGSPADWHTSGTHPVAWVAEGSHATYARDGDPIPIWAQCSKSLKKLPHAVARILSFVLSTSEREVVSHELSRTAFAGELQPAVRNANYLAFRGAWGVSERTTLARWRVDSTNYGPLSPACQALWIDPLWTIFCNPNWRGPTDRCRGRERRGRVANPCGGDYP